MLTRDIARAAVMLGTAGLALAASAQQNPDRVILRDGSQVTGSFRAVTRDQVVLAERAVARAQVLQINFGPAVTAALPGSNLDQVLLRNSEVKSGVLEFADRSEIFLSGVPLKTTDARAIRLADGAAGGSPGGVVAREPQPPQPAQPPPPPETLKPPKDPAKQPEPPKAPEPPGAPPTEPPKAKARCPEVADKEIPAAYLGPWEGLKAYGQMDFSGRKGAGQAKVDQGHSAVWFSFTIKPGGEVQGKGICAYHFNVSGGSALGPMPVPLGASASLEGGTQEVPFSIRGRACADGSIRIWAEGLPKLRMIGAGKASEINAWNVFPPAPRITIPPREARIGRAGSDLWIKHEVVVSFAKATGNPQDGRVMRMGWEARSVCGQLSGEIEQVQKELDRLKPQVQEYGRRTKQTYDRVVEAQNTAGALEADVNTYMKACPVEKGVEFVAKVVVKRALGPWTMIADPPITPEKIAAARDWANNMVEGETGDTIRGRIRSCAGTMTSTVAGQQTINRAYEFASAVDTLLERQRRFNEELNRFEQKLREQEELQKRLDDKKQELEACLGQVARGR